MSTNKPTNAGGLVSIDSHIPASVSRPTDMDLMLYFDGELSDIKRIEIESYINRDLSARKKLAGLRMASGIVFERASALKTDIDLTDAVMSAIDVGINEQIRDERPVGKPIGLLPVRSSITKNSNSSPANDNSRGIFTLAAMAVAAAAAMMIWGRTNIDSPPSAKTDAPTMAHEVAQVRAQEPQKTVEAAPAEPPTAEVNEEHGVEVAAVDFGAHMGTIFYVPSDGPVSNATTTVVWVDDDVSGGKQ